MATYTMLEGRYCGEKPVDMYHGGTKTVEIMPQNKKEPLTFTFKVADDEYKDGECVETAGFYATPLRKDMLVTLFFADGKPVAVIKGVNSPRFRSFSVETQYLLAIGDAEPQTVKMEVEAEFLPSEMRWQISSATEENLVLNASLLTAIYLPTKGRHSAVAYCCKINNELVIENVFDKRDYDLLDHNLFTTKESEIALEAFHTRLSEEERELIRKIRKEAEESVKSENAISNEKYKTYSSFILDTLDDRSRLVVKEAIKGNSTDEMNVKSIVIQALRKAAVKNLGISAAEIRAKMFKAIPGQRNIIKTLPFYISSRERHTKILLIGPPATAKWIAEEALAASGIDSGSISVRDIGGEFDGRMLGTPKDYSNSAPSCLANDCIDAGILGGGLVMAGIDRAYANGHNKNGDPAEIVRSLVYDNGFEDRYLETKITAPAITFFVSETKAALPEDIVNAMDLVLPIENFSDKEMAELYFSYFMSNKYEYGIAKLKVEHKALAYLAKNCTGYDPVLSVRIGCNAVLCRLREENSREVTLANVKNWCKKADEEDTVYCRLRRNTYSGELLPHIKKAKECALNVCETEEHRNMWKKRLDILSKLYEADITVNEKAAEKLDEIHYGHREALDKVKDIIKTLPCGGTATVGFYGPPGSGKSSLGKACMSCFDSCNAIEINLATCTSRNSLCGIADSSMSIFEKKIAESNAGGGLVLLVHELDKAPVEVQNAFLPILENDFVSEYSDVRIPVKAVFANFNELGNVIEPLRDRFTYLFKFDGFGLEDKSKAVPMIFRKESRFYPGVSVKIDSDAASYLARCTDDAGMRELTNKSGELIRRKVSNGEKLLHITRADCEAMFKEKKRHDYIPREMKAGQCLCMAVRGDGQGAVSTMTASFIPEKNPAVNISPLIKGSAANAISNSSLVWLKRHFPEVTKKLESFSLYLNISGDSEKDGSSLGVATVLCILSAVYGDSFKLDKTAYTGCVEGDGDIVEIGGAKEKVTAAIDNDLAGVFVPGDNMADIKDIAAVRNGIITVSSAATLDELVRKTLPEEVLSDYVA